MKLGDAVLPLGLLVWLSVSVGPWWVGLALFGVSWALNIAHDLIIAKLANRRTRAAAK